jgi:apolipoprotein D and lipocalin family protein
MLCRLLPLLVLPLLLLAGCATFRSRPARPKPDVSTVPYVDLARYAGRWYIIERVPYFLEKGRVGTSDNYGVRRDGRIDVAFAFRKGSLSAPEQAWRGVARVVAPDTNAEWQVRFLWPMESDYRVIELDPGYRWAVVANRTGSLLWVMARMPTLDPALLRSIRERLVGRRLDVTKLQPVPQLAP